MTTAADLVARCRRRDLLGTWREETNRLDGAVTTGATSIVFKYDLGAIQAGAVVSVDLELIRIWEVSNKTATVVERAVDGSTAASHSDLALVRVNPRFSDFDIFTAINDDLDDLSSPANGLYRVRTKDITWNSAVGGYDYVSDAIGDPIELRWKMAGSTKLWPRIKSFDVARDLATTEFASGVALLVYEPAQPGNPIRVRYRAPFTRMTTLADDVQTVSFLPATANDLPPLGAAINLLEGRPVKRSFTESQGDTRRGEEVTTNDVINSPAALRRKREARISAEAARLSANYPRTFD